MEKKILIIVDPQYDFINGTLAVKGSENKMLSLANYIESLKDNEYSKIIITADFHPKGHCSFEIWPVHCVAYSLGSAIYDLLLEQVYDREDSEFLILPKGIHKEKEEYSVLQSEESKNSVICECETSDVIDICGIAGDFCVYETIKDLISLGYKNKIRVLLPYTASIDGGSKLNDLIEQENLKVLE